MRKYLLPETGKFYKANLHCHTVCSDGSWTPEEVKKNYMEHGYSVVAYTDHNLFLLQNNVLSDENFIALNGVELEINDRNDHREFAKKKTCHLCYIAYSPKTELQPMWNRKCHYYCNEDYADKVKFDESLPDYERVYTHEGISDMIKRGREAGFFVTYNHPTWSMENYAEYSGYEGMDAMEMVNYGCLEAGYDEYNSHAYDDLLRQGKRLFCINTDDNHNRRGGADSFGGFTMIKAEKLTYEDITASLKAGNFYASQAPEIYSLYFEDGKITVNCSDAARIFITRGVRRTGTVYTNDYGKLLNTATFEVKPDDGYVRITVVDEHGNKADTNAYFTDELFAE